MIHLSRREHLPFFVQFLDYFFINIATNLTVTYKPSTFSILILQLTMQYKSIVVLDKFFFYIVSACHVSIGYQLINLLSGAQSMGIWWIPTAYMVHRNLGIRTVFCAFMACSSTCILPYSLDQFLSTNSRQCNVI